MASSVKSGFSTINRLLGKKPKDDVPVNTTSASGFHTTTNTSSSSGSPASMFSRSMSNLDTTSQYNKIVPLAAMSNAPFEQTFRITVSLPRDQLYVVRVGAKTKLDQILDMTCTAKQLDRDKFHFRHPADNSQVFSNTCTIGEVGLNEIRLVPITDPKTVNSFSSSDLGGMRPGNRNSFAASSNFGMNGRNGHGGSGMTPTKSVSTTSPYSSTNSLNSLESAQQLASRPAYQRQQSPASSTSGPPVAPMRKKRAAPRPPSQIVIPEDSTVVRQMNFHVSTPNLSQPMHRHVEAVEERPRLPLKENGTRPVSMYHEASGMKSSFGGSSIELKMRSVSRTSSNASQFSNGSGAPEPNPRHRSTNSLAAKRKKAAPAPPPRSRDSLTPTPQVGPPVPTPRTMTPVPIERVEAKENNENISKTLLNSSEVRSPSPNLPPARKIIEESPSVSVNQQPIQEVVASIPSKVVEIKSTPPPTPAIEKIPESPRTPPSPVKVEMEVKQNGSPVSIAIVTSNGNHPTKEDVIKPPPEPSSDEDEGHRMNIYNLNTKKSIQAEIVQANGEKTVEDAEIHLQEEIQGMILDQINGNGTAQSSPIEVKASPIVEDLYAEVKKPQKKLLDQVNNQEKEPRSDSPLWTYTLPAPPHFADGNNNNLLMAVNGALVNTTKIPHSPETPAPTETFNSNVYYNYTEHDDGDSIGPQSMTTTVVSDVLITPVIKERIPMLDQPLMLPLNDNHFHNDSESSDFNSSSTLTSASPNNLHADDEERRKKLIINSDIEDGYHGRPNDQLMVNEGLIKTLEKRREKFIENELEQLVKGEQKQEDEVHGLLSRHQMDVEDEEEIGLRHGTTNHDILIETLDNLSSKSNGIERENEEPKISTSPVEDGLPSTRTFIKRTVSKANGIGARGVQRSDSFHSTRIEGDKDDQGERKNGPREISSFDRSSSQVNLAEQSFEQRRSSFLQEMENTKNSFNRRTSSELSISDAPSSLQSLEVMKNILMATARRSSKEEDQPEKKVVEEKVIDKKGKEEEKEIPEVDSVLGDLEKALEVEELKMEKSPIIRPVEIPQPAVHKEVVKEEKPQEEIKPREEPKPVETKPWVYTGPPKINLGSWSERPKIQVCLKTDSDYHHSIQGSERSSGHPSMEESEKSISLVDKEKPSIEPKLPVVRGVELKKSISIAAEPPKPIVAPTVASDVPVKSVIQRPLSMHSTRFLPMVRGFQLQARTVGREEDEEIRSTRINPVLMRSDSNVVAKSNGGITVPPQESANVEKEKSVQEQPKVIVQEKPKEIVEPVRTPPPATMEKPIMFSQSTLRRTGLKEKILSQPKDEEEKKLPQREEQPKINLTLRPVSMAAVPPPPPPAIPSTPPSTPEKMVPTSPPPPPPPILKPSSFMNPLASLSSSKSPMMNNNHQKPVVRGVVKKAAPITSEVDPRAQLLDSIKNFNFNNLRKM